MTQRIVRRPTVKLAQIAGLFDYNSCRTTMTAALIDRRARLHDTNEVRGPLGSKFGKNYTYRGDVWSSMNCRTKGGTSLASNVFRTAAASSFW